MSENSTVPVGTVGVGAGDRPPVQPESWWRRVLRHTLRNGFAVGGAVAITLLLVLGDLDTALSRIQVSDVPARSLTSIDSVEASRQAWCLWHNEGRNPGRATIEEPVASSGVSECIAAFDSGATAGESPVGSAGAVLVFSYVLLDALFITLYFTLAIGLIRRQRRRLPANPTDAVQRGLRTATARQPMILLFGGLGLAEMLEGAAQLILAFSRAPEGLVNAAGAVLAAAPIAKWILVALLALVLLPLTVYPFVRPREPSQGATSRVGLEVRARG